MPLEGPLSRIPLTLTLSHQGRGNSIELFGVIPSPLVGEGWGEGAYLLI